MRRLPARCAFALAGLLVLSLPAYAAKLLVKATPEGALVTIEGKSLPSPATFDLKSRPDSPYLIVVEKTGYQTETVSYSTKQKLKELTVALEPLQIQREVTLKSNLEGATVTIDGKAAGVTPFTKVLTFTRAERSAVTARRGSKRASLVK